MSSWDSTKAARARELLAAASDGEWSEYHFDAGCAFRTIATEADFRLACASKALLADAIAEIERLEGEVERWKMLKARSFRSGWHEALANVIEEGADPVEMAKLFPHEDKP